MSLKELSLKIEQKTACLAIIGLGYVGLPVAALFCEAGFDVIGVELRQDRVDMINSGQSPIDGTEPGLSDLIKRVIQTGHFHATNSYEELHNRDIILIDVETPVDDQCIPQYESLKKALKCLAPVLKLGALIIVESTIAPGTMQEVVLPLIEKSCEYKLNEGFYLGNCPERVMPGKLLHNLEHLSRVVGGNSPETAKVMIDLYKSIVHADLDPVDWVTAELVKTVENAYRDVQIAFANEVALICDAKGADVWKVRELVNKSPSRNMHLPGAGVGGHCIPKDPWLLVYGLQDKNVPIRLVPAAREINNFMPIHMAELLEKGLSQANRLLAGSTVLVLGYAYLENSDDIRNSPSKTLIEYLTARGVNVIIHDPYVNGFKGNVIEMARDADAVVLMVAHQDYKNLDLHAIKEVLRTPVFIDGRAVFNKEQAKKANLLYIGLGRG